MIQISDILSYLDKEQIPYSFIGNSDVMVERFSSLSHYNRGSYTWIKGQESIPIDFDLAQITLAVVADDVIGEFQNVIRTPMSKRAFFSSIEHFFGEKEKRPAVGQFTYVSPRVKLGKNVQIGHNCTLDGEITIGDNTVIWNHVTIINRVSIGRNCDIHSGTVIGHDGFGYTEDLSGKKQMIKHFGGVSIGNNVLIGDNVCICRGTIDDTVLGDGVKIDNLSHIAHNCIVEENAAMAYPCKLGGSTHVKRNAYLAAAIIRNQSTIGENAFVGMGAVVTKDVDDGQVVAGNPAKPFLKKK